jgi:hypothetical protein
VTGLSAIATTDIPRIQKFCFKTMI